MTSDQEMDRVERIAKLLSEPDLRDVRESRKQTEKLIRLLEMQKSDDRLSANPETDRQIQKLKTSAYRVRQERSCIDTTGGVEKATVQSWYNRE